MRRPYKFHLVATVQHVNEDGTVTGEEQLADGDRSVTVYGLDGLRRFADEFEESLNKLDEGGS